MSNSVTELKHCPFCGNTPRLVDPHESERSIEGETDNEEWLSFVECDCVDMFFVKGSATSQEEAKKSVVEAWNNRAADRTGPPLKSQGHVNGGAFRKISIDEWQSLGGDCNKLCDWHEGIGYVIYDDIAHRQYLAKTLSPSTPTN